MIEWRESGAPFPPVESALAQPNGLLAASENLTAQDLRIAYPLGIFPWYGDGDPVLWWCPDPRMILEMRAFHVSRSLRRKLRAVAADPRCEIRVDSAFEAVMRHCAAPREGQSGTWITEQIVSSYGTLAEEGLAHSVEFWQDERLAGGIYGVCLGRMFFGESMFSLMRDGSKISLCALVAILSREGVPVIDCQQRTPHLASLGAREIPRGDFCALVDQLVRAQPVPWQEYRNARLNRLLETS